MHRATGTTYGTWAIAAVLLTTLIAFVAPAGLATHATPLSAPTSRIASPHAPTHQVSTFAKPVSPPAVAPRPAAGPSGPIEASATITSSYTGGVQIPVTVTWTIAVANTTIDAVNVSMSLEVTNGANLVANLSTAPTSTGQTSYSMVVDYAALLQNNYGGGTLPTTPYAFTVWLTAMNASNASVAAETVSSAPVTATLLIANVGALLTNTVALYSAFPIQVNFTTSYAGNTGTVVNALNASIALEVRQITAGCNSVFGFGTPCPEIANTTITFSASNTYALSVDSSYFTSGTYLNGVLPLGQYQIVIWNILSNVSNPSQEARAGAAAAYTYVINDVNSALWLSPSPTQPSTVGNVTFSVQYYADYLSSANVTVYAGATGSGTVLFTAGVFQAGEAVHAGSAVWTATSAGEFTVVLNIQTRGGAAAGPALFPLTFNVTKGTGGGAGVVYYNQTIWKNTSTPVGQLIGGLSTGVAAALLLVVGLVVGMIVAMVLGRMLWSGSKAAPAQPWQAKGGANECGVCHQTFATEAELKDHQKQAHGMQ